MKGLKVEAVENVMNVIHLLVSSFPIIMRPKLNIGFSLGA